MKLRNRTPARIVRPKINEDLILASIKKYLTLLDNLGLLTYRRITVSGIPRNGGRSFSKNADMSGMADLLIFIRNGPTINVELKSTLGVMEDSQIKWQAKLQGLGHIYWVVRSLGELEALLKPYLAAYQTNGSLDRRHEIEPLIR